MSSDAVTRVSVEIAGSEITFETGKMAKQASGAVVVRQGDTMVLSTATAGNQRDVDFLPLTVDVEERMYAAGKIPGSFFKREGRSGEKATLTARLIDAGTEEAILMVEAGADEIPEAEILDALDIAHAEIKKLCAIQHELRERAGKPKTEVQAPQVDAELLEQVRAEFGGQLDEAT